MSEILAIDPATLVDWQAKLRERAYAGAVKAALLAINTSEAEDRIAPRRTSVGDVAVISLHGFMSQRPSLFSLLFGGTSTEGFAREVVSALGDRRFVGVVADVNSPGGSVFGLPEAAAAIRRAKGRKPFIAVSNSMMGSAAYWLGSQADQVIASPSSLTGSIGAITEHADLSEALAKEGIKLTVLKYGRNKDEGHPAAALSPEARAHMQETIDAFGRQFEADVARGRGVSVARVQSSYGQGRAFHAGAALAHGLVDDIAPLGEATSSVAARRPIEGPGSRARAIETELRCLDLGLPFQASPGPQHETALAARARELQELETLL